MLANANPHQSVPASRSAREFVAVCARHNVPYGELNCLPTLLRELKVNKHFAMHFWSVVAGMTDKQAAQPEAVLAAIVEAVAGQTPAEVREAGPAQRILLERLQRLISGQDVEPEEVAEIGQATHAPAAQTVPSSGRTPTAVPAAPAEDVLPIRRAPHSKRRRGAKHRPIDHEPIAPVTNPAWTRDESLRLVLVPEPPAAESTNNMAGEPLLTRGVRPQLRRAGTPPVPVPLSGYAEEGSHRSRAVGVFAVAAVIALLAGGSYVYRHGGATQIHVNQIVDRLGASVRAGYDSAVAAWSGKPAKNAADTSGSSNTTTPSAVQPPAPVTAPSTASSSPATSAPAPGPSAAAAPVPQTISPAQSPAPKARPTGLTPEQSMAITAAYNQQREGLDLAATPPESGGLVQVPEGEMNAHLVSSRVPVLPDDARANGVTGVVRMQATISRNGYVSRLHVLQGPTELRPPAIAAVSAWRYRPYLVNGQPMDVSTIITVDFSSL